MTNPKTIPRRTSSFDFDHVEIGKVTRLITNFTVDQYTVCYRVNTNGETELISNIDALRSMHNGMKTIAIDPGLLADEDELLDAVLGLSVAMGICVLGVTTLGLCYLLKKQ